MWTRIITIVFLMIIPMGNSVLADCAWILWHDLQTVVRGDSSGPKEWTVMGTAKTFEQCTEQQEMALAKYFADLKNKNTKIPDSKGTISRQGALIVASIPSGRIEMRFSCWPENRDPRH